MPRKKKIEEEKTEEIVVDEIKEEKIKEDYVKEKKGFDEEKKTGEKKADEVKEEKKAKLAALKKKAKELEGKVEGDKTEISDLKKKIKEGVEEKANTLVPIEDYLKSSIHLGTRVITPDMKSYVYKRRADGLAVFNTALLDDKIKEGAEFLSQYAPEDVILVCKREAGWKAVELFSKTTGIRAFTKKYPAGILTNSQLENFIETDLVFICDPWIDKN